MPKKKPALPLKPVLEAIDTRDLGFYDTLTEEEKKAFSPWILMRYVSSASSHSEYYLMMTNELVNVDFSVIVKHPKLAWKLLATCGSGQKVFHPWIAPAKKSKKKNDLKGKLQELNQRWNEQELDIFIKINDNKELREYLLDHGLEDSEIKELLK